MLDCWSNREKLCFYYCRRKSDIGSSQATSESPEKNICYMFYKYVQWTYIKCEVDQFIHCRHTESDTQIVFHVSKANKAGCLKTKMLYEPLIPIL